LFGFLTTEPNDVVGPLHPKAMPVILRTEQEIETWMTAPANEALKLQSPLPNGTLQIVAPGGKTIASIPCRSRLCYSERSVADWIYRQAKVYA
jgi:putative SOS response-associated peptidase YedK